MPSDDREHAAGRAPCGRVPAERERRPAEITTIWSTSTSEQAADLAGEQAGAGQRRGAEPLDHAVAPLEAGGDRQRGERRRHHRQRQHAGREDVDGRVREVEAEWCGAGHAADQHDHRDHHGEQQLLAVAQHQPRLHAGLGGDLPRERRGAGPRGERSHGSSDASRGQLPSGQLEEDVLEVALAEGQRLGQHAVLLAPPRHDAERGRVGGAGDQRGCSSSSWVTSVPARRARPAATPARRAGNGLVTTSRIVAERAAAGQLERRSRRRSAGRGR